jgi:transmembrane sensor
MNHMSENDISELLEKYDEGLTNLEEEERIYSFMLRHPTHLRAPWFLGTCELHAQKSPLTPSAFHAKRSEKTFWYKSPHFRIAATVLLICAVGIMIVFNNNQQTSTVVSADAIKQIILPDGSVLTLNKNTVVRYSSRFNNSRNLWLDKGEAFFEVVRNPDTPFIVHTGKTMTRVTGTSFNIRRNTDRTEVTVLSGQVIFGPSATDSSSLTLTKGMMGEYNANAKVLKQDTAFDSNNLAWKTHRLEFSDVPLQSVVKTLEDYFQIRIQTRDSSILTCRFRGIFEEANLNEIVQVMNYSLDVKLTFEGSVYNLSGRGCNP